MLLTEEEQPALLKPLNIKKRPDLIAYRQLFGDRAYWRIKDPVAFEYFQLRDEEYAILDMLDGKTSMAEIQERFDRMFAPSQLELPQLQAFLRRLHSEGLVISEAGGQAEQLLERHTKKSNKKLIGTFLNPLAIKMRGVDPDRFLSAVYPYVRWLFSPWFLGLAFSLIIAAFTMVVVQADVLISRLPEFQVFFAGQNILWLAVTLMCVKTIHELSHAMTCKHFGGECHQIGFMLLVFTPCLFCNVSDSWMMGSRWHRIAISLAGIIIELILAAICTFLWWFSEPGLLNTICLNVMFVGSVSTVLFNGNPLLRYDGYYILSDLTEEANLAQRSTEAVKYWGGKILFGSSDKKPTETTPTRTLFLVIYGLTSNLYRWTIVLTILWFAQSKMREMQLSPVAHLMTALAILGMLKAPISEVAVSLNSPVRKKNMAPARIAILLLLAFGLISLLFIPLPMKIEATAVTQPQNSHQLFVPVAGRLFESAHYGETVKAGQMVALLRNDALIREVTQLEGSHTQAKLHLKNLESRRSNDPAAQAEIPTARGMLDDLQQRLEQRRTDLSLLELTAPASGVLLPPPPIQANQSGRKSLRAWSGTPLAPRNQGSWLEEGALIGIVGEPDDVHIDLLIPQNAIEFVQAGQAVTILLDQHPLSTFAGTIDEISAFVLEDLPNDSAIARELPVETLPDGSVQLADTYYRAKARLNNHKHQLVIRSLGRAKITVAAMPLGARIYRFLRETFRIE